jgi:hypothetical protein
MLKEQYNQEGNFRQWANMIFALFLRFIFAFRTPVGSPKHRLQRKLEVVRIHFAYLVPTHGFEKTHKYLKFNKLNAPLHVHREHSLHRGQTLYPFPFILYHSR